MKKKNVRKAVAKKKKAAKKPAKVHFIPAGYHTVTPYMISSHVAQVLDFAKKALSAKERYRMAGPDGSIAHAEFKVGDSIMMIGAAMGDNASMPGSFYLYVKDCDAVYKRALEAGATSMREPADQFYGDRNASVKDAAGNLWSFGTKKENLSSKEVNKRAEAAMKSMPKEN
jgi:PhnB protein